MDDYYSLLGIDSDAPTDEIRTAYRDKKAALDAKGDKGAVARVNKAWNVLSDPYQRGRYDAAREQPDGDEADDSVESVSETAPPARRRRFFDPPDRGSAPPRPVPVAPAGMTFPPTRRRITAMVLDLCIIFLLFMGSQVATRALLDANHPDEVQQEADVRDALNEARDDANDADAKADTADDRVADLEQQNAPDDDVAAAREARDAAREEADQADRAVDGLEEDYDDVVAKLQPTSYFMLGVFFVVAMLYLVVPSALSGQTLGKRIQKVRVVRQDGSKLGWAGALVRYGLIALPTFLLASSIIGPLAGAIALIVILGWMRSPTLQGMHDRVAKTFVVEA